MFYNFYRDNDEITVMITTHVSSYEAKLGIFDFCKNREEISRSEKKENMLKVSHYFQSIKTRSLKSCERGEKLKQ